MDRSNENAGLKPTHPEDTKAGLNYILLKSVQYGLQEMIMERDVPVVMRDGTRIYINVFRPNMPGRFPVVLSADPYGKDLLAENTFERIPNVGVIRTSLFGAFESPDPGFWVPNGYAVVKVAVRGSSKSEGVLSPFSSIEAQDDYELIEWAGVQEWSDGNVGTNGVSYLAITQWMVAPLSPPHLKAMIVWEGCSDIYREWAFHAGIPDTGFYRNWHKRYSARWPQGMEDLPLMQKEHLLFDKYWAERQSKLSEIKIPIYVGASWSTQGLHNRGSLEGFKQSASEHKWLEIHGRKEWEYYYSRDCLERQKRFFDYFLKGVENGWLDMPRVRLEVRERFYDGIFRFENEWPLARTKYTELFLDGRTGTLCWSPSKEESRVSYNVEPDAGHKKRAVFKLTFDEDIEITGYMKLRLWVTAEGSDDMDLFIGIRKLDKLGKEVHMADFNHLECGQVATGWLRVSHRELDETKSTPHQPWLKHEKVLKLKRGDIVPVEIEILPSSTLFKAGESLVLVMQGSDLLAGYPDADNENRYAHNETVNKGKHIILTGGAYDSHLLLPVIPHRA